MAEQTCRSSSSWRSWNRRAHSCHSHVCCNPPDSAPPLPHSPTMVFNESKVHKEGCRQAIQRSEGHSQQKPPTMSFCAHARSHMHDWLHASFLLRNVLWRTGDNVSTREAPRERLQLTGSGRRDIMWTLIRQCRAPPNRLLHHGHWELHLACVALRVMPVPLQIASRSRSGEQPCLQSMDEVIECLPVVRPYLQRLRHGFLKSA